MDKNWSFVPKNSHLVWKKQNNCNFYTKNEVFAKKFDQNVQILDKYWSFVPINVHLVPKKQKICTFYTKNEVFAKQFDQNVQIMDKKWSFVPKNVHLVPKNGKICTFYTKTEVLPKNFTRLYTFGIKTVVLYPKMHIWSRKKKKLYFLHYKCSFCQKISLKCTNFG